MDVLYLYKENGSGSLRYSLRSLVNVPHERVIIVGDCPAWVKDVVHVPHKFRGTKIQNEWAQLLKGSKESDLFLLFNDDFYILKQPKSYTYTTKDIKRKPSPYYNAYLKTKALFLSFGNFEVHAPMLFSSANLTALSNQYDVLGGEYLHRSLYGNYFQLDSVHTDDNKIYKIQNIKKAFERSFVSTTDNIEKSRMFVKMIRERFPDKCRYER